MRNAALAITIALFTTVQFSCGTKEDAVRKPKMKTFVEQYTYMMGLDIGRTFKDMNMEIDFNALLWGIQDILKNRPELLSPVTIDSIQREFSMKLQQMQMTAGAKNSKQTVPFSYDAKRSAATKPEMKTFMEQYSYFIGLDIGRTFRGMNTEIDYNALLWGMQDILKNRLESLPPVVLDSIKREFSIKLQQLQIAAGAENSKQGEMFLAENKKKPGVITTASGLQYMVINQGKGPQPKLTDKVKVHYTGTSLDGKEFDSSFKHGAPAVFPLKGIIPAWIEALQLMNVGSKYKLFVPPNLAYGERGKSPAIGPNSVLVFEVELLEIEK